MWYLLSKCENFYRPCSHKKKKVPSAKKVETARGSWSTIPVLLSRVVRPNRWKEVVDKFRLIPELGGHTPQVDEVVYKGVPRQLAYRGQQPSPDAHLSKKRARARAASSVVVVGGGG